MEECETGRYLVGVDEARPGADLSCVVQGERSKDGVVTIHSIRYFIDGAWIKLHELVH